MRIFAVAYSTITGKATVHCASCQNAKKRPGRMIELFQNLDPVAVGQQWDANNADLGLPKAKVCQCAENILC